MQRAVVPFLSGGLIVAGVTLVAESMSPRDAALFWALPLGLVLPLVFLRGRGQTSSQLSALLWSALMCLLPLALFLATSAHWLDATDRLAQAVGAGMLSWAAGAAALVAYWRLGGTWG